MKRLSSLGAFVLGVLLTVACASVAALACPSNFYVGYENGDSMTCTYSGEDADWCYYHCYCSGRCDGQVSVVMW